MQIYCSRFFNSIYLVNFKPFFGSFIKHKFISFKLFKPGMRISPSVVIENKILLENIFIGLEISIFLGISHMSLERNEQWEIFMSNNVHQY